MPTKNYCVDLKGVTAQELYFSELSYWGREEIQHFKDQGYKYWHYKLDYFSHETEGATVVTLEQLQELRNA